MTEYKSKNSTDEPDLCRLQAGDKGRASLCLEAEDNTASSQRRGFTLRESASRLPIEDNGCALHSDCLTCPYPDCVLDLPGGVYSIRKEERDAEIVRLYKCGKSTEELMEQFGLGRRTIQRALGGSNG